MPAKVKIDLSLLSQYLVQGKTGADCARLFGVSESAVSQARRKLAIRQEPQHVETRTLKPVEQLVQSEGAPVRSEPVDSQFKPPHRRHKLDKILDIVDGRLTDNS